MYVVKVKSYYDVKFRVFIPFKYHFLTHGLVLERIHIHIFSHLRTSLKISSRWKMGFWIRSHLRKVISTSALLCNQQPAKWLVGFPTTTTTTTIIIIIKVPPLLLRSRPSLTSGSVRSLSSSSSWMIVHASFDSLRHFLTSCTLVALLIYTSVIWQRLLTRKYVLPIKSNNDRNFFWEPNSHCRHCTSTYPGNSIWVSDWLFRHLLHVTYTTSAVCHRKANDAWQTHIRG